MSRSVQKNANYMIRLDGYFYKEDDAPKILLSLDWYRTEDYWRSRYFFDKPKYDEELMEKYRVENLNRYAWLRFRLNLFHYNINFEIRLNKVGNVMHGRVMNDIPRSLRKKEKK